MAERSDAYIIGRLIHQTRLLIATDDTIPTETKLQAQPVLKEFEAALAVDEDEQDHKEIRSHYYFLCDQLSASRIVLQITRLPWRKERTKQTVTCRDGQPSGCPR